MKHRSVFILLTLVTVVVTQSATAQSGQKASSVPDGLAADFERFDRIADMYNRDALDSSVQRTSIQIKQLAAAKQERTRLAATYAEFLKNKTKESEHLAFRLSGFDRDVARFEERVAEYKAKSPKKIQQNLADAMAAANDTTVKNRAIYFGREGEVTLDLQAAKHRYEVLAILDPKAAEPYADKLKQATDQIERTRGELADKIISVNAIPPFAEDAYSRGLADLVKKQWAATGNPSQVLGCGVDAALWEHNYYWEWDGKSWHEFRHEYKRGFVVVKATETIASLYEAELDQNDQDKTITVSFKPDPKSDPGVINKVLTTKVK